MLICFSRAISMKHFLPQCQGKKLNSLRILNRASQYCRWREILNEKANLKVHACSKRVFQNSDKKTQDNGSIMWLVWNELFKWIYLETNESEFFLCFLKIKTWRHILGNTYYLGTEVLFCFVLFCLFCEWKAIYCTNMPIFYDWKVLKLYLTINISIGV